ncbi:MAG: BlaI/MecI/CopY family transcriptional regulator [Chitinophagaceae bacterium]|nr:BlaI/MecI/CopY family transcriptional regulator [Chitinophagaceae bacterium]
MERLSQQEEDALFAVFKTGEGNVKNILQNLQTEIPYTTLASTIKNLEKKGFLKSRLVGNTYLYKPAVSEEDIKKGFVGSMVKSYFASSYKELVSFFVKQKKLSAEELKEIINLIEKEK